MPNKLKKVYELEGLVCDLHAHFTAGSGSSMGISKSKATELLSSTIFDYEPNSRYACSSNVVKALLVFSETGGRHLRDSFCKMEIDQNRQIDTPEN